jgi:hypothetical protein
MVHQRKVVRFIERLMARMSCTLFGDMGPGLQKDSIRQLVEFELSHQRAKQLRKYIKME